jgi:hypothetical protein
MIVKTPVKFDLFVQDNGLEFERLRKKKPMKNDGIDVS